MKLFLLLLLILLFLLLKLYTKDFFLVNSKKKIYTLWMGENKMSKNRLDALNSLKEKSGCNVVLITPKNINNYILKNHPLHKSFKYLSSIHKADYFRCYLMHHYGGGYSDLKKCSGDWSRHFERLYNNNNIYAIGLKGKTNFGIAFPQEYNKDQNQKLRDNHENFIGVSYFIYKKNTHLTNEWYNNLNKRLDYYYPLLKKYPANFPRESSNGKVCPNWEKKAKKIKNNKTSYPISWNRILGQIIYPLQLKYIKHIKGGLPKPDNSNYLNGD
jgi:hypothetical protein